MRNNLDIKLAFGVMALLLIMVGFVQSWGVALAILNLCLISAVMSMGVNIQWGYSGLINFGVMGFLAIGGLATIVISTTVNEAGAAGGFGIILSGPFVCVNYKHFLCASKISIEIQKLFIILLVISVIPMMKLAAGPSISAIESMMLRLVVFGRF